MKDSLIYIVKVIALTVIQLARMAWSLPQAVATGLRHRRRQAAANLAETERLDRIRHPSKYLGE